MKNTKLQTVRKTIQNFNEERICFDRKKVEHIGRSKKTALAIFDVFCKEPVLTITKLVDQTKIPRPTVTNTITKLCNIGIIHEIKTGKKWGKRYRYNALIGSAEEFANNTLKTQNKNGVYLYFNGRDVAEKQVSTPPTKHFNPYEYHNNKPNNIKSNNKLYIGDNLDVMKFVMPEYKERIDLAYLDILYNLPSSRKIQAYDDSFDGSCDLLGNLYPRLQLVKQLLKPDGIIALSLSEHEIAYVKILMDEVFGRENIVNNIVIESGIAAGPLSGYTKYRLPVVKSYLLVYAKDKVKVNYLNRLYTPVESKFSDAFNIVIDKNLQKSLLVDYLKKQSKIVKMFEKHNLEIKTNNIEKLMDYDTEFEDYMYQKLSKKLYKKTKPFSNPLKNDFNAPTGVVFECNDMLLEKTENNVVYHFKPFLNKLQKNEDGEISNSNIRGDVWPGYYSEKSRIQNEGNVVFNGGKKPVKLVRDLLKWIGKKDALVLDCYAGSGTTAEAVMVQNKHDGGARSFILCQLPEKVNPKSEEAKKGFKTIDQITIKRIKNVIKELNNDDGFQIFR